MTRHQVAQKRQLSMKEMLYSGDYSHWQGLGTRPIEHISQGDGVVHLAMQDLRAVMQPRGNCGDLKARRRSPDEHQLLDRATWRQRGYRMACHKRAERKPRKCQRPVGSHLRHYIQQIKHLSTPFVVDALTFTHTPEIKAHGAPATLYKRPPQGLHHLVVHRAAKHRVRVGNDGGTCQIAITGLCRRIDEQLQKPDGSLNRQTLGL